MRGAYYNENDPFAAAWLGQLMQRGHIATGEIDTRSITAVSASDLRGFTRCHFFAGIGGWDYALALAEWPENVPVWTGSCPCQPLSGAGQRKGHADERHLWPAFHGLIAECAPAIVFGEQVASADGREWLAGVRADLEVLGYAVGCADLCAASVSAPHARQRLFWLADADGRYASAEGLQRSWQHGQRAQDGRVGDGLGDGDGEGRTERVRFAGDDAAPLGAASGQAIVETSAGLEHANGGRRQARQQTSSRTRHWDSAVPTSCSDGKSRRVELSIQPLAHGIPNRVAILRGAGNAIIPQVAEQFIRAYIETQQLE